jgi:hypothetical protein
MGERRYPASWGDPTVAYDLRDWPVAELQVITAPGVAYAPQRSLNNTDFVATNVRDKNGQLVSSITAAGIYTIEGGGYIKLTGGSGSTFVVRAAETTAVPDAGGGTGTLANQVQGNVAAGAADSGNPVEVGGAYVNSFGGYTDGNRTRQSFNIGGSLNVALSGYPSAPSSTGTLIGYGGHYANQSVTIVAGVANHLWNGANTVPQPGEAGGAYAITKPATSGACRLPAWSARPMA